MVKNSAPRARELERALLTRLSKYELDGTTHVSVFAVGPKSMPAFLTVGDAIAQVLEGILTTVLGRRPQPDSAGWVLFQPDADAILCSAANLP